MDKNEFIEHLTEAIDTLENELTFVGPYTDAFEFFDDGVVIPFDDGSVFRVTIEKIE